MMMMMMTKILLTAGFRTLSADRKAELAEGAVSNHQTIAKFKSKISKRGLDAGFPPRH